MDKATCDALPAAVVRIESDPCGFEGNGVRSEDNEAPSEGIVGPAIMGLMVFVLLASQFGGPEIALVTAISLVIMSVIAFLFALRRWNHPQSEGFAIVPVSSFSGHRAAEHRRAGDVRAALNSLRSTPVQRHDLQ